MVKVLTWDAGRHKEKSHNEITVEPTDEGGDVFADNNGVPFFIGLLGNVYVPELYEEVMERLNAAIYFEFDDIPETYEQVMNRLSPAIYFEFNGVSFVPGSYVPYDTQIAAQATIYFNNMTLVTGSYVPYNTQISNQGATIYYDEFPLV